MKSTIQLTILSVACVLLLSCSPGQDETRHSFRILEENGVPVAETKNGPKYTGELFHYEEVVQLKQDESIPESLLYRSQGMSMDDNGFFYVADSGNSRIVVFDNQGHYYHQMGRQGSGPGEFQGVFITAIRDSLIYTYNSIALRAQVFSTAGRFLYSITRQPPFRMRELYEASNGDMIFISSWIVEPDQQGWDMYSSGAMVLSADGDTLSHLHTHSVQASRWMNVPGSMRNARATRFYSGRPRIVYVPGRGLLMSDASEPVLEWYDLRGNLTGTIRIDMEPDPVTPDERNAIRSYLRRAIENAKNPEVANSAKVSLENSIIPNHKDFTISLHVDEAGFIWLGVTEFYGVGLWERRPEYRVLSPSGEYLGNTKWPGYLGLVSHGHFLLHATDPESGEEIYTAYRIIPAVEGLKYPN